MARSIRYCWYVILYRHQRRWLASLATRASAALALIVFTVPATFIFHAYWGVPGDQVLNQQIHFMKNLAIVGGPLSVFAHSPGRLALDRE